MIKYVCYNAEIAGYCCVMPIVHESNVTKRSWQPIKTLCNYIDYTKRTNCKYWIEKYMKVFDTKELAIEWMNEQISQNIIYLESQITKLNNLNQ